MNERAKNDLQLYGHRYEIRNRLGNLFRGAILPVQSVSLEQIHDVLYCRDCGFLLGDGRLAHPALGAGVLDAGGDLLQAWGGEVNPAIIPENILRCMKPADRKSLGKAGLLRNEILDKALAKSERELQHQIVAYLRLRGIEVCCPSTIKRSTIKLGWPDLTFCYEGRPFCWEIKMPGAKLRPEQEALHPKLKANGWDVSIIRSLDEAKEKLS